MRSSRLCALAVACALIATAVPAFAAAPGSLDPTFGNGGKATALSKGGVGYAVAVDARGRVVVAGYTLSTQPDFAVARFLSNGTLDTSFGDMGRAVTDLGGADYAYDMALQPDGKIVLAGQRTLNGQSKIALVRYTANGRLDANFGGGDGITLTGFGKAQQAANAVIVTPDGKIVVAGYTSGGTNARSAIVRYTSVGGLDHSFSGDGRVSFDLSASDEQFQDLAMRQGGYVAAGYAEVNLVPAFDAARITPSGRLDTNFSKNGYVTTDVSNGPDQGYALLLQPDGKIVVTGHAGNNGRDDWGTVRYLPGGGIDKTWGAGGRVVTSFGGGFDSAYGAGLQQNGRIVVAGRVSRPGGSSDFGLVRYMSNGTLNLKFGADGKVFTDFGGGADGAQDVIIRDANGKILAAGDATKSDVRHLAVARYVE
jgi:uncharacterized delta-60 repeat protein